MSVWSLMNREDFETIARLGGRPIRGQHKGEHKIVFSAGDVLDAARHQHVRLSPHLESVLLGLASTSVDGAKVILSG